MYTKKVMVEVLYQATPMRIIIRPNYEFKYNFGVPIKFLE